MRLTVNCFARGLTIDKLPVIFSMGNRKIRVETIKSGDDYFLWLSSTRRVDLSEITIGKDDANTVASRLLAKCRVELNETALTLEGVLITHYFCSIPPFDISMSYILVKPDNKMEEALLKSGKVIAGGGSTEKKARQLLLRWRDDFDKKLSEANNSLYLISLLSNAFRAHDNGDQEVAFSLYFRILEAFFGDGSANLKTPFLNNKNKLSKYFRMDERIRKSLNKILKELLSLPSKCLDGKKESLIEDMLVLRHKMVHFDMKEVKKYYNPAVRIELALLNRYLKLACYLLIREKVYNVPIDYSLTTEDN